MITKRENTLATILEGIQIIISLYAFEATSLFFQNEIFSINQFIWLGVEIILVWGVLLHRLQLGIVFRHISFLVALRGYIIIGIIGGALLFLTTFLFFHLSHLLSTFLYLLDFLFLNLTILVLFKVVCYHMMSALRKRGYNTRNIIIIADSSSSEFIDSFMTMKDWGYRIVAILTYDDCIKKRYKKTHLVTHNEGLNNFITFHPIDDVFYCISTNNETYKLQQLITDCDEIGVNLHVMQDDYFGINRNVNRLNTKFNRVFISHTTAPDNYIYVKIKDIGDFGLSLLALILTSPITLLIALLIKLEDGGPVLFKQMRIGRNGRRFKCYKFRSMVINAEELKAKLMAQNEADGPVFKIDKDPRVTKVGHIIRKLSLDELPQFLNVLRGEMSIVGPRPPLKSEVLQYERSQLRRLSMKPGITGSWQVWGRHTVTFEEWMKMDLDYIDNWSIWLDLRIMFATVGVMLKATGR